MLYYRLVLLFFLKMLSLWWLIIKESNGVITDSGQRLSGVFVFLLQFVLFPMENSAAKGIYAPAGVEAWAQDVTEQELSGAEGLSRQVLGRGRAHVAVMGAVPGSAALTQEVDLEFAGMLWLGCGGRPWRLSSARRHHSHQLRWITYCLSLFTSKATPHISYPCTCRKQAYCVSSGASSQMSDSGASA